MKPRTLAGDGGDRQVLEPPLSRVRHYAVLGGILRSELEFPELAPTRAATPDWTLEVIPHAAPAVVPEHLGERSIGEERYTLGRTPDGYRLDYSHAGVFEISADGSRLRWYRRDDVDVQLELARAIVLGPALALSLELREHLCLHASAVEIAGQAVAFLGAKYHGKSTLAAALTAAGARLVTDDLLAVQLTGSPRVRPGIPSVRLWNDAAERLQIERFCGRVRPGVKTTASGFGVRLSGAEKLPISAIYLLEPFPADADDEKVPPCDREPLTGGRAALQLALQAKLPPNLVGSRAAGEQLRRCAALAAVTPVFRLRVMRDFDRLHLVVRQLFGWHAGARPRKREEVA